jgi:peptidoglycan/LPS O-acetylase OafA/YrhL
MGPAAASLGAQDLSLESLPAGGGRNHFNLLRLLAACSVIISHAYALTSGPQSYDPFETLIGFDLGTTAVLVFFAISGYFISLSFDRRQSNIAFVIARATRILPGLLVVSLVAAFVVGPLLTTLPLSAYFAERAVWLYTLQNLSIIQIMSSSLPGVFATNPVPDYVNASLWTLFFEVACYIGLFFAGILGFLRRERFLWIVLAWLPVYAIVRYLPALKEDIYFAVFSLPFLIGMAVYQYRESPILNGWFALVLFVAATGLGAMHHPVEELWSVAVAYGALWLGFARAPALLAYNKMGDFSYGTYIYGFLVGQVIAAVMPHIGVGALMALSLSISLLCGMLSWKFVERPALQLRKTLIARSLKRPEPNDGGELSDHRSTSADSAGLVAEAAPTDARS